LNHWIVPQQGKNHSGFNEAPEKDNTQMLATKMPSEKRVTRVFSDLNGANLESVVAPTIDSQIKK
jgi:hypothetical protein